MALVYRNSPANPVTASDTALNGEPSGVDADAVYCDGYTHVSVVGEVTANSTDTSDYAVWFGFPTTAKSVDPPTILWARDTRINGTGTFTTTEGTNGSVEAEALEIPAGAQLVYVEWEARTDADTRTNIYVHLDCRK